MDDRHVWVHSGCPGAQRFDLLDGTMWSAADGCNEIALGPEITVGDSKTVGMAWTCYDASTGDVHYTMWVERLQGPHSHDLTDCHTSTAIEVTVPLPPDPTPVPEPGLAIGLIAGALFLRLLRGKS